MNLNKFVPFSDNRYVYNVVGEVIDVSAGQLVSFVENGKRVARMDWYDGVRLYDVGLVAVVASWGLNIPREHWESVEVLFNDGDATNTMAANIDYRINKPIEVKDRPGFFHVPNFTRYAVNADGVLVNVESGHVKTWYVVKPDLVKGIRGGYRTTQVVDDRNYRTVLPRHRALALVFLPCPGNPDDYLVNHLNGVGGDDWIENLEWTDHAGNNKHAYDTGLFDKKLRPVLVKNVETGEVIRYKSMTECCKATGIFHATLSNRLKNNPGKGYSNGFAYKLDDDLPWQTGVVKERITTDVIFRNVFTNETFIVSNQREASDFTKVPTKAIWYHISTGSCKPINGFLFRKLADDGNDWPVYTGDELKGFVQQVTDDSPCGQ